MTQSVEASLSRWYSHDQRTTWPIYRMYGKKTRRAHAYPEWRIGRSLIWDVTVTDTAADSYLAVTPHSKAYSPLRLQHHFVLLAFETLVPINKSAETSHFFQRLTVMIQRFNAFSRCQNLTSLTNTNNNNFPKPFKVPMEHFYLGQRNHHTSE